MELNCLFGFQGYPAGAAYRVLPQILVTTCVHQVQPNERIGAYLKIFVVFVTEHEEVPLICFGKIWYAIEKQYFIKIEMLNL